ncbi:MAG: molybdopterin-dependent oxidoreductase, partial [Acetobacteraceae bacterium]|nr:molybdopterin-dependent oxidoreductase [Acetobacteraceae bacterium]
MSATDLAPVLSRRAVLGAGAALVVRFAASAQPARAGIAASLAPDQLDSWIAVRPDGSVAAFFGKMDPGQGLGVAIAQIVAEELDVPFARVQVVMGDTATSVNQGGASGSTGIEKGGVTLRYAAAEARRVLVERAAIRLGVEPGLVDVRDGVPSVRGDPSRHVSYGELVDDGRLDVALQWNGQYGNDLLARGRAEPKRPAAYRLVGETIARPDIAAKAFGQQVFVTDIRLPGMLHARMVRPPAVGAEPVAVDEASVGHIPGARVFRRGAVVAVLAPKEWDAIRATRDLRVTWSE